MLKHNKGITLIALIITVIVLLILATVSIDLVVGDGLFDKAGNAEGKTNSKIAQQQGIMNILQRELQEIDSEQIREAENEQMEGNETESGTTGENQTGGNQAGGGETGGNTAGEGETGENQTEIHSWTRTGDVITCSHCSRTYTIGNVVNYEEGGQASTSISETASGIAQAKTDGQSWASSYGTEQTLSKDANTVWVVLGIEDSNKDGNNETLLLTTQTSTTGTITLYGAAAYNNVIEELNRMCKELYGENARGMTIEDVNNCLGYNPALVGGMYTKNSTYYATGNLTTKLSELEIWSSIENYNITNCGGKYYTPEYPEGTTDASKLGKYLLDGYDYYLSNDKTYIVVPPDSTNTSYTVTTKARELIFGSTNNYNYFLATRGVGAGLRNNGYAYACFGPGRVSNGRALAVYSHLNSLGPSFYTSYSIRTVVSLKSEIPAGM